ncbi:MAG: GNAT family N-acetyltransferase [Desulfovibrio sp.]|nr:GNAT family N-acetyltransferase [Desulfovibrio sp.]MBI4959615.1 GNAT family N-acetyltransferase [Desulfovibrio sp.]
MNLTCLARQGFDSEAFGLDYYRVTRFDYDALAGELASLPSPFMADAKLPAQDVAGSKELQKMGLRKICVQPTFVADLSGMSGAAAGEPQGAVEFPQSELDAHAANFQYNRFGLDPLITDGERIEHQRRWIFNSMASTEIMKFLDQGAFVSFKLRESVVVIDLVSALPSARGRGSLLLGRLKSWAAFNGYTRIEVTTESENVPACLFYEKNGFRLAGAAVAFHMRRGMTS